MIDVRGVTKRYGREVEALRGVDLRIEAGESVAIMGASGSGKSTLMNLIGLLDRPTTGEILVDGRATAALSDREAAELRGETLGFVFQSFNLLPRATALENVEVPLMYALAGARKESAQRALERVGLADRIRHRPTELSGGQQQRVALARALVNSPKILLADEPTGNLDSRTSNDILELLIELNREGQTLVMVTHEEDVARRCARIVRFRDGQIVSDERDDERSAPAR